MTLQEGFNRGLYRIEQLVKKTENMGYDRNKKTIKWKNEK